MCHASAKLLFTLVLTLCLARAHAHDTWLLPDRAAVAPKTDLRLDLTSGMEFPNLDHPIKPDRIDKSGCRLSGREIIKLAPAESDKSLRLDVHLAEPGVATVWLSLKPRSIELNDKQVTEYLHEIGASDAVRQAWADAGKDRRWRELYTKHAKTFVRVGSPADDRSWAKPVGMRLEIVPAQDPTALRVGDKLSLQVLRDGKPLAGFVLGAVHDGAPVGKAQVTDKNGVAAIELNSRGRWLIRGTDLRPSKRENIDWESDFSTLTIEAGTK